MKRTPSKRAIRYAYGLMNSKKSRYKIAIEAGYSVSTARVPKLIENKRGFSLAMAKVAGETENTAMQIMFELQARDLSKESTADLIKAMSIVSKVWERFAEVTW